MTTPLPEPPSTLHFGVLGSKKIYSMHDATQHPLPGVGEMITIDGIRFLVHERYFAYRTDRQQSLADLRIEPADAEEQARFDASMAVQRARSRRKRGTAR